MTIARTVVTLLGAAFVAFSAVSVFIRASWVAEPLTEYGVPRSWWPWLGTAKAAGALGLVAGLVVPGLGVAAGICLVLYFIGAEGTVLRARSYSHVPFPLIYLAVSASVLALRVAG
jgi:hypothetical protein